MDQDDSIYPGLFLLLSFPPPHSRPTLPTTRVRGTISCQIGLSVAAHVENEWMLTSSLLPFSAFASLIIFDNGESYASERVRLFIVVLSLLSLCERVYVCKVTRNLWICGRISTKFWIVGINRCWANKTDADRAYGSNCLSPDHMVGCSAFVDGICPNECSECLSSVKCKKIDFLISFGTMFI